MVCVNMLQDLMNFVLSKAGQLLQGPSADAALRMSAAQAIVQACEVAESHNMPMPASTLDGLLQLIQQATDPDVSPCILCSTAWTGFCMAVLKTRACACTDTQSNV